MRCLGYMKSCFVLLKARISCVLTGDIASLTGRSRLTEADRVMDSRVCGESSPARGVWECIGVIVRGYQHQQTRAAAAREGCRVMDAARKNRRPGG